MKCVKGYLNLADGGREYQTVNVTERVEGEVCAVYIDGISEIPIDPDFGAGIELEAGDVAEWMADYRHTEFWCRPEFGTDLSEIPDETQGLIYRKGSGEYGVVLPVVSEQYKCVLRGGSEEGRPGTVTARLFSWYGGMTFCKGLALLWAEGEDPYALLEKCAKVGTKLLGRGVRTRSERRYPEVFEYLGWCSWDAFEIRVDEEGLLAKCEEFHEKGIPARWVLLDDMWAEVRDFYGRKYANREEMFHLQHSSRLYSFRADPVRFPNGLKGCIEKINERGVLVGMWHPTTGYWMGIDPDGELYGEYKDCLIRTEDGRYIHGPGKEEAYRFYSGFHDYLRHCGAEFVKIDNQSMIRRFYKGLGPVGRIASQVHDAMEASAGQHFDNQMINCMGTASEDMWNRSVSPLVRCSDDFQPEDGEWFVKHILQCSYNSLIQGQFYYTDWDMWWTDDGQAVKNSILRAVSGGPIYVSDPLDRSRAEVLSPLALSDGRILRCERPGVPSRDCLTQDPTKSGRIFKIQNMSNGCGILAAFNLDEENRAVEGRISPADVEGLAGEEFAVYEHFSKELRILEKNEEFGLRLADGGEYRLYVMVPLKEGRAVIGRTDKFISPATVRYGASGAELVEDGPWARVEEGRLVLEERGRREV